MALILMADLNGYELSFKPAELVLLAKKVTKNNEHEISDDWLERKIADKLILKR